MSPLRETHTLDERRNRQSFRPEDPFTYVRGIAHYLSPLLDLGTDDRLQQGRGAFAGMWGRMHLDSISVQELYSQTRLQALVRSSPFTGITAIAIMLNALMMGHQANLLIANRSADPKAADAGVWGPISTGFIVFFAGELLLRFGAFGKNLFRGRGCFLNYLDVALVAQSLFVGRPLFGWLRIFSFARTLRVMRVMKMFPSFNRMVYSTTHTITSLGCVLVMLGAVMYAFAMLLMLTIADYPAWQSQEADRQNILDNYGTVYDTMRTLFTAISGGNDWYGLVSPLTKLSRWFEILFAGYIFFMLFGVLNVITSLFVDSVNRAAKQDPDIAAMSESVKDRVFQKALLSFFREAKQHRGPDVDSNMPDNDNDNSLSWQELQAHMAGADARAYLGNLDFDAGQASTLFDLLDVDKTGRVDVNVLVDNWMRLKGQARGLDIAVILHEQGVIQQRLVEIVAGLGIELEPIPMMHLPSSPSRDDDRFRQTYHVGRPMAPPDPQDDEAEY